jgi:hypothetical protein
MRGSFSDTFKSPFFVDSMIANGSRRCSIRPSALFSSARKAMENEAPRVRKPGHPSSDMKMGQGRRVDATAAFMFQCLQP